MEKKVLEADVRTDLLPALQDRIEKKLNKPARKLGLGEAALILNNTFLRHYLTGVNSTTGRWYSILDDDKVEAIRAAISERSDRDIVSFEFTKVVLIASEPKLAGWTFLATIEHTEKGNILRAVPGREEPLPARFRDANRDCDHCGYDRRRKDTYVVLHDDGTYKQVGRSCIKDFLGHGDPKRITDYFNEILNIWTSLLAGFGEDDPDFFGACAPYEIDTARYLAIVAQAIRSNGWISRGQAFDHGTYSTATCAYDYDRAVRSGKGSTELIGFYGFDSITDEAAVEGKAALEWARNLGDDDVVGNDYLHNLRVACSLRHTNFKRAGIVASAVSGWQRATEKADRRKIEKKRKAAALHIPAFEGRTTIVATVLSAKWRDDGFGSCLKITVEHEDGWRLWGTAPRSILDEAEPRVGDVVTFDAGITVSDDDKSFGFFKRPTKGAYVSREAQ